MQQGDIKKDIRRLQNNDKVKITAAQADIDHEKEIRTKFCREKKEKKKWDSHVERMGLSSAQFAPVFNEDSVCISFQ